MLYTAQPKSQGGSARRGFICRVKLGRGTRRQSSPSSAVDSPSRSSSLAARQSRLRHQQYMLSGLSSPAATDSLLETTVTTAAAASMSPFAQHQQPYALMHVTGFVKSWNSTQQTTVASSTNPSDGYGSQSSAVVSLLGNFIVLSVLTLVTDFWEGSQSRFAH